MTRGSLRAPRRLLSLTSVAIALFALRFFLFERSPPYTTWRCLAHTAPTCEFKNLYYLHGEFIAYIPTLVEEGEMSVPTGIGVGSPIVKIRISHELPNTPYRTMGGTWMLCSVMWSNIFRTLYPGISGVYAAQAYEIDPASLGVIFFESNASIPRFGELLSWPFRECNRLPSSASCWERILIGLPKRALVEELRRETLEMLAEPTRKRAYLHFTHLLRLKFHNDPRVVTIVVRHNATRKFLNEDDVIAIVREFAEARQYQLAVVDLAKLSLHEQATLLSRTSVLIAMHGAALGWIPFMSPHTTVVELFPYLFRKEIYFNIASLLDLRYLDWQCQDKSHAKFDWNGLVKRGRRSQLSQSEIVNASAVLWKDPDARNYWRNQDIYVDQPSFKAVMKQAFGSANQAQQNHNTI